MCCFTQPVKDVSATRIFVRSGQGGRQFIVYEMKIDADRELAMVLPIPVPVKSMEQDVRFFNLEKYETFFKDLNSGYPVPRAANVGDGNTKGPLEVIQVGSYVASFVPSIEDFSRLDPQFRLPPDTWKAIPQYRDYGFAVFKLKPGNHRIHPMAFDFPRRNPHELFFPTVHIHDGKVHEIADFDHLLFLQRQDTDPMLSIDPALTKGTWFESEQPAKFFVDIEKTQGIVLPDLHLYRVRIFGDRPNKDVVIV